MRKISLCVLLSIVAFSCNNPQPTTAVDESNDTVNHAVDAIVPNDLDSPAAPPHSKPSIKPIDYIDYSTWDTIHSVFKDEPSVTEIKNVFNVLFELYELDYTNDQVMKIANGLYHMRKTSSNDVSEMKMINYMIGLKTLKKGVTIQEALAMASIELDK